MEKLCRLCGKSFTPRSTGGHTQVYCSAACRQVSWDVRHERTSLASLASEALTNRGDGRAICGQPPTNNLLAVDHDHDHVTGRVRGLLCAPCNRHLGWYDVYKQ